MRLTLHGAHVRQSSRQQKETDVKKLLLICAIALAEIGVAAMLGARPVLAQQPGPGVIMPGDKGRWHGYSPAGYIGAHPSNRGVNSCTWSIAASCAARRNGSFERDGIRHQVVKRPRDGKLVVRVFQNGTRVK